MDSTFSGELEGEGEEETASLNETMYWDQIPDCHLADVMLARRIWGLGDNLGGEEGSS